MVAKKERPLSDRFRVAAARVEKVSKRPSNERLLDLYGLYKQATEGDVTLSRPGMLDLKGRAKFDAWAGRKGMSKDEAMKTYVALVEKLVAELS